MIFDANNHDLDGASAASMFVNLWRNYFAGGMSNTAANLEACFAMRMKRTNLDHTYGFESVSGGSGNDILVNSYKDNVLIGEDGDDQLMGCQGAE